MDTAVLTPDTHHTPLFPAQVLPLQLSNIQLQLNGRKILQDINLSFSEHRLSIVLGPNGAGKTLLLKLCHGIVKPTSGRITWSHQDALSNPLAQSMVFQRPVILRRTVAANIEYALRACRVVREIRQQRLQTALHLAGLSAIANRPARRLSGGEQQRLALARAWAILPQVLFLDEPTSHLDPAATRKIEQMIRSIHQAGTTVIMTTHDLGQAKRLANEIVFLHYGHVVERSHVDDFFAQPNTTEAAAFIEGRLLW